MSILMHIPNPKKKIAYRINSSFKRQYFYLLGELKRITPATTPAIIEGEVRRLKAQNPETDYWIEYVYSN